MRRPEAGGRSPRHHSRALRGLLGLALGAGLAMGAWAQAAAPLSTPLTPRLLAQALTVRNLELAYGRDSVAVSSSLAAAEAAMYEPILFATAKRYSTERQRTAEEKSSNLFAQSETALDELGKSAEAGVRQRLPTGAEMSLSARQTQRASNILAKSSVALEVNAGLVLNFKQPLWRGRGVAVTETDRRVAEVEAAVAQWQYLQQLYKVVADGLSLYWQAEVASRAARLREELLASTDALAEDARARIEAGKLAPRANLELARVRLMREADVLRAAQARDELKLRLLSNLDLDASQLASLQLDAQPTAVGAAAASPDAALQSWAPYQVSRLRKRQGELRLAFADNQRRPAVDLVVSYTTSGLTNANKGAAWEVTRRGIYPEWYVGLNMEIGALGNERADAQWTAQVRRVAQSETEMAAIRQAFHNDRQARQLALDQLQREAALMAREVETRQSLLDDERQRFNTGLGLLSTLLQAEQDLVESRIRLGDAQGRLEGARVAWLLAEGTLLSAYGIDTPLPQEP